MENSVIQDDLVPRMTIPFARRYLNWIGRIILHLVRTIHGLGAFALITFVGAIPALGGTTALLLLCVFVVVNIAVLVLRRDPVAHEHFRTPTLLPVLGALTCAFLAGPWTGRDLVQYEIAGLLMAIGIGLWLLMRLAGVTSRRAIETDTDR